MIWPQALEHRARARRRVCSWMAGHSAMIWPPAYLRWAGDRHRVRELVAGCAGHVIVMRAVDWVALRSSTVRRFMRLASRSILPYLVMNHRLEADVWHNDCDEDKALLDWHKARREELGLALVYHAIEMMVKAVRHVVVRRQH
ncbi:hypothetical protein PVAP13_5NG359800 [Panicum virgatum]|uniref:Uncharacterized protein n=1 Tax=Panicum virgatum TaxID=38727 RepID=A0A8T0RSV5_PANVG|nr:hypothetical protein PVAP13_5NG359800 [Panicum virgatum]